MAVGYVNDEQDTPIVNIKVFGIGGGGNNAVDKMMDLEKDNQGITLYIANTDMQALNNKQFVQRKIQLGAELTKGKGAGSKPEVGRLAAEESLSEIKNNMMGADIVFLATGMGGGTGTGAIPVFAAAARELGILSVAIVTKPFKFEGEQRARIAEEGIKKLQEEVDCLIVIPNDRLSEVLGRELPLYASFSAVDDVLREAIYSVMEIILKVGFINMDLSDIKSVMEHRGIAIISMATAEGENRAIRATESAISSPLLENIDISKAKALLFNISANHNSFAMAELEDASNVIYGLIDQEKTSIKYGVTFDDALGDQLRVSIFATGIQDGFVSEKAAPNLNPGEHFGIPDYLRR